MTDHEPPGAPHGPEAVRTARGETREVELSRAEQALGRRAAESRATIPDLTLATTVDMEACAGLLGPGDRGPTYLDMVTRACALALREQPRANATYRDGRLLLHSRVNIALTLSGALPTLFDADLMTLAEIAAETALLGRAARSGPLGPARLAGATFTVADLSPHRLDAFAAPVPPQQAALLAVGSVATRPAVRDGALLPRLAMTATLACDHRILHLELAARFLERIQELLEGAPATLL